MEKYKIGFVAGHFNILHLGHLETLRRAKERSKRLIVGVLDKNRMEIPSEERLEIMKAVSYVDDAVLLEEDDDFVRKSWNSLKYDCFFTAEGISPEAVEAREWLKERSTDVVFLPMVQEQNKYELRKRAKGIKILAFGAGKIFDRYMRNRGAKYPPAYVFDNDPEKWGMFKHGIKVKPPSDLPELVQKGGKILVTCADILEVSKQLEELGITEFYSPR